MTGTDRRRFPAITALAVAGAMLGLLFSEADAHSTDGPHGPEHTHFYLWRTTMTVGKSGDNLGYDSSFGSISTDGEFNYPPWSSPGKHHFDADYEFTLEALYIDSGGDPVLVLEIDDDDTANSIDVGNLTLWIRNTSVPLPDIGGNRSSYAFSVPDGPDLDWSEDEEVRVALVYERQLPSAPENVSVTAPSGKDGTLEVSWDAADDGTFPIECYLVEFLHPSGDTNRNKQSYPGSRGAGKGCGDSPPTSVKRTDLEAQIRYEVRVQALSGDGDGDWSVTKTAPRTHGIPSSCDLNPGDLWCGVVTVGRGSDTFGYDSQTTPDVGGLSDDDFDVGTNSYTIWAIAVSSSTAPTPGSLNFTFDLSTRPTAADRDKLVLHVGSAAYRFSDVTPVAGRAFTWNTADLDWSRKEYVIVRLRESSSENRDDSSGQKKQSEEPGSAPDKPTGLEATASHDSVTLTWDDPGDDSITGYVILRRIPGVDPQGHFNELVANTGSAATTYTDGTVAAETRYTYRIKAINGAGMSERSRWFHIDTPAAPVPDKPTGLDATASHNSVTLTWDDPGDDSITGYVILRRVRVNNTGGEFDVLVADTGTDATTYTDNTVAASTTYTYRIKAINGAGTSERSRWFHIDTPAAPAAKPAVADGPPGLAPNAPNPFNANTLIPYRLDVDGPVRLEIYNLLGQPVRTLVDQYQDAGFYKVRWDARDRRGALVSAGMYLVRLHYPGGVQTQRLLYLK